MIKTPFLILLIALGVLGISSAYAVMNITLNADVSILGLLDMNDNKIVNLATPTNPTDAATKDYVDSQPAAGSTISIVASTEGNEFDPGSCPSPAQVFGRSSFVDVSAPQETHHPVEYIVPISGTMKNLVVQTEHMSTISATGSLSLTVQVLHNGVVTNLGCTNSHTTHTGTQELVCPDTDTHPVSAGDVVEFTIQCDSLGDIDDSINSNVMASVIVQ